MAGSAWTNQIQNTVIVAGPTGTITGFFVYSGTPGPGNPPVGSWTIPGTTKDPFGNTISDSLVIGQQGNGQVRIVPGNPSFITFPVTGTWQTLPVITAVSSSSASLNIEGGSDTTGKDFVFMQLNSGIAGSGAQWFAVYHDGNGGNNTQIEGTFAGLQLPVVASMSAVAPGTGTSTTNPAGVESWHTATITGAGFSAGTPAPSYKLYPDDTVSVGGQVSVTSGTTSGTIFTLPAAYRPSTTKKFALTFSAGTPATAGNCQATISSSGTVQLSAGPTGSAYSINLDVIRFPLDF